MELLKAGVKDVLIPGSPQFLILGLLIGVLLLFGPVRAARWGRPWLTALLMVYLLLSLQGTSDLLVWGLSRAYKSLQTLESARGARVVVVLSNGVQARRTPEQELGVVNLQSSFTALEAARVYRLLGAPRMLVSGGPSGPNGLAPESEILATALEQLGIPKAQITLESKSPTTYWQAENSAAWLREHDSGPFVLVTSPEHMLRAAGLFRKRGLDPVPSVSGIQYGGPPFWLPTLYALQGSESAMYEYLAACLYWLRGWI